MSEYFFRIRFRIDDGSRLGFDADQVELDIPDLGEPVVLKALEGDSLSESEHLAVVGPDFDTEDETRQAGQHIYNALLWCGLRRNYGFDLGTDRPGFTIGNAVKEAVREETGYQLLEDYHGLQVYDCSLDTKFGRSSADLLVTKHPDHFRDPWEHFVGVMPNLGKSEVVALELWNIAYFEHSPRARFLTRMFAVEAILPKEDSSPEVRDLIDGFLRAFKVS